MTMSMSSGANATRREIVEQLAPAARKTWSCATESLLPIPVSTSTVCLPGADQQRVEPGRDVVLLVSRHLARPHHFRHDAKKRSAIERISPVRKNAEFKVAKLSRCMKLVCHS